MGILMLLVIFVSRFKLFPFFFEIISPVLYFAPLRALLQAAAQSGVGLSPEQLNIYKAHKLEEIRPQVETRELGVEDIEEVLKLFHGENDVIEV